MRPIKIALLIPLCIFIYSPNANAQTDIASYLLGSWGLSADCKPTNAVITYNFNSAGNLVGTHQAPTAPKQPHLKRTYTTMLMNSADTATLVSTVSDIKTARELGTLETEVELGDQKYRVKNQKRNGKPIIVG